jgi:PAS domain S-box-containing protein
MTTRQALNSLQTRSLLVLLLAVTPPIVVLLTAAAEWQRSVMADVEATALRSARHAAAIHERLIEESERLLRAVAQQPQASPGGGADLRSLLASFSRAQAARVNVGVISPDGRIVLSSSATGEGTDVADRPFFRRAMETRRFTVGGYERNGTTGHYAVTVAYPSIGRAGGIDHVLFAELSPDWLHELAIEGELPAGTTVAILDEQGAVLVEEPDSGRQAGRSRLSDPAMKALLASKREASVEATAPDGTRCLFAVKPLRVDSGSLFVAVGIPNNVAIDRATGVLTRMTGGFVLAVILAFVVASVGNRLSFGRPLKLLMNTANRLSDGDLETRTGIRRAPEELKQLARAFDQMAATLQQRERDVALRNAQLTSQERRFRALIENDTDGIILIDGEGVVLYASPSTKRILGYSPEELVGRPGFEHMHPDEREVHQARLAQHVENPSVDVPSRFRALHKDGSWRWLESVATNLLADPAVGAIVVNYRDITLRLEAEQQLRQAHDELERRVASRTAELAEANAALRAEISRRARVEEMLRKLARAIEQTSDSVLLTNHEGVIEYVNPAFERMTGFSSEDAIGATPRLVDSGHHDRRFFETLWATILSGQTFRAVFVNRTKDGREFHEDGTITPLRDNQGNITHFVSTGRDITKHKRTEEALRRLNDRLEHEATRIASALHDEAGQFLTAAHITLADVERGLPPSAREGLQDVKRDLEAVEEQLRRLAHELRPRILEDMGLANALTFLADGVARRTGIPISVKVSLERRCGPLVETAIYRLVQEGLTNMSKHARATRGTVVLAQDGENVLCSIRDDGVGFDLSAVIARRDEFGLGLLGIQDRLEVVAGMLEIISAPGEGTELRAIVPLES